MNFEIELPILFGFGRINNITESWRAARMLQEFQKEEHLNHQPNKQEINDLANILAQRKFTRLFDRRQKTKADLKAIHQVLINNNLINESNINYFTTLSDMWRFGANTERYSGFSMALGFEPQFTKYLYQNLEPIKSIESTSFLTTYLTLKTILEKPISQKLQFSINSNIKYGHIYYQAPYATTYQHLGLHLIPYLKIGLGYYPNTRTYVNTNISSNSGSNKRIVYAQWQSNLYYYISPKTRLAFRAQFKIIRDDPFDAMRFTPNVPLTQEHNTSFSVKFWHNFL